MATAPSLASRTARAVCGLVAVSLLVGGLAVLASGALGYRTYWGGRAFAPFIVLVGGLLLFLVIFRWKRLNQSRSADPSDQQVPRW